jgi:hypothetical protein
MRGIGDFMARRPKEDLTESHYIGGMSDSDQSMLIGVAALAWVAWCVFKGRTFGRGKPIYRSQSPILFWAAVGVGVAFGFALVVGGALEHTR